MRARGGVPNSSRLGGSVYNRGHERLTRFPPPSSPVRRLDSQAAPPPPTPPLLSQGQRQGQGREAAEKESRVHGRGGGEGVA